MAKIYASSVIAAPMERVWDYIRDFSVLHKWFPGVTDCRIESGKSPDSVGCVRDFGLPTGARMRERLLALSDRDHSFSYTMVESPLPISEYTVAVRLLRVTDGQQTFMEITAKMECPPAQEGELVGFLKGAYQGAFDHLKKNLGRA